MKTSRIVLGCILASFVFLAHSAGAQVITEFSAGITAGARFGSVAAGPDGNLWFTESNLDRIGRITPLGVVTEFGTGITAGAGPSRIAAGADGNLWFTEPTLDRIGRITPLGVVTEFSTGITAGARPFAIAAGADGNLWFTEQSGGAIGRITPAGDVTEFGAGTNNRSAITAGPDGNLWFTESRPSRYFPTGWIGRITPLGVVTYYRVTGIPVDITAGPDGNLWFAGGLFNRIGRITPDGVVTEFMASRTGGAFVAGITAGPDGNLWFTERGSVDMGVRSRIARITPAGVVTEFGLGPNDYPTGITAGPDGNLWFTEVLTGLRIQTSSRIGRFVLCCNTPVGSDVDVNFDGGVSVVGDVSVTFAQVTSAGDTLLDVSGSCPAVPPRFSLGTRAVCYQLTTTAVYTPPAEVCIDYSGSSFGLGRIVLLHYAGGTWVNVTTSVDTTNEVVCGDVDSLSPFVVAVKSVGPPPSITTLVSSLNPSRFGRAIVFKASVAGNLPTGTVQFMDGGTDLGSPVTLSGRGNARRIDSRLSLGTHAITAVYSGDANNATSTSSVLIQTVK